MKIKGWIFAIVVFLPIFLISQNSQNGNWLIYFGNQKLDQKWNWHNEIQYRNHNFIGDLQQFVVRTGFGYNLSDNNNTILLGYGYFHSQNYISDLVNKVATNEHRIFQQFVTKKILVVYIFNIDIGLKKEFLIMIFKFGLGIFLE